MSSTNQTATETGFAEAGVCVCVLRGKGQMTTLNQQPPLPLADITFPDG